VKEYGTHSPHIVILSGNESEESKTLCPCHFEHCKAAPSIRREILRLQPLFQTFLPHLSFRKSQHPKNPVIQFTFSCIQKIDFYRKIAYNKITKINLGWVEIPLGPPTAGVFLAIFLYAKDFKCFY
jgi:hypothetical protein